MGGDPKDLVKLTAGVLASAAMLRCAWQWYTAREDLATVRKSSKPVLDGRGAAKDKQAVTGGGAKEQAAVDADVWIYFGSQSGTAEGFAKEMEQEAGEHGLKAAVLDLEDFDPDLFMTHKTVVLLVATYGEGDPTDNAVEFFKWVQEEHPSDVLNGVGYCVMGLGNRQYVNFNSCGKVADTRMQALGALQIYQRGEGDDDQNIEEDFEQWKEQGLWAALRQSSGLDQELAVGEKTSKNSQKDILAGLPLKVEVQEDARKLQVDPLVQVGGCDILSKWYFQAHKSQVVKEYELRQVADPATGKSAKHLDFDVKSIPSLDWRTADNFEILPTNPRDAVEWFAERLGVKDQLECSVSFVRAKGVERPVKKPFPTPCTLFDALSLYCDLQQAPSKRDAKKFCAFIDDEEERLVFEDLLEDRQAYQWLTGEGVRLTFRELFELFLGKVRMDIGTFLQLCPRQKSRPYTIASSSREDRNTIGVCVSIVAEELKDIAGVVKELEKRGRGAPGASKYVAVLGQTKATKPRPFWGSCSTMLCTQVRKGDRLWVNSRASTFRLPRKSSAPIVMVGAGTGIAPFRAFAREFQAEKGIRQKTMLFFGCQRRDVDFLYKAELTEALNSTPKMIGEIVTAFSREQQEKVYVQHKVREKGQQVAALIKEGGYVYVCGATAMGQAIREELAVALGSSDHVTRLQTEGRYVEELW